MASKWWMCAGSTSKGQTGMVSGGRLKGMERATINSCLGHAPVLKGRCTEDHVDLTLAAT